MTQIEREKRLDQARQEVQRCADAIATLGARDREAAAREREIDEFPTVTSQRMVERENLGRLRHRLADDLKYARHEAFTAQAALDSAKRVVGGVIHIKGLDEWGIGPTSQQYLRATEATMHVTASGIRVEWNGADYLIPWASLREVKTEDEILGPGRCEAAANEPIPGVARARVLDGQLVSPWRFGSTRGLETVLSRLRNAEMTLGSTGVRVTLPIARQQPEQHIAPFAHVCVVRLDPVTADSSEGAQRVALVWFRPPPGATGAPVSHAARLAPSPVPSGASSTLWPGISFGAAGVLKFLDVSKRPGLEMWVSPAGLRVVLDGAHWLVPWGSVRFAKLQPATASTVAVAGTAPLAGVDPTLNPGCTPRSP
jgi:hypothetical protein